MSQGYRFIVRAWHLISILRSIIFFWEGWKGLHLFPKLPEIEHCQFLPSDNTIGIKRPNSILPFENVYTDSPEENDV